VSQTAVNRHDRRRRAATSLLATELVGDVARRLEGKGIDVMPVKGALLQHWLYDDPSERHLTDVDLLVRPADLRPAVRCLEAAGYNRTRHQSVGGRVMQTPFGLALDLHSQLFDQARYRMPTSDLFARSWEDRILYDATLRLPSPLDVYAHLIGKFGSDHLGARSRAPLDEIARMATRLEGSPETVARHLHHCGMRRVARYALPLVHEVTGDTFALTVRDCLRPDPVGQVLAAIANPILARASVSSRGGALVGHSLNDSIPRGLRSGARAMIQRSRRRQGV
jgi:hypothetical protein